MRFFFFPQVDCPDLEDKRKNYARVFLVLFCFLGILLVCSGFVSWWGFLGFFFCLWPRILPIAVP